MTTDAPTQITFPATGSLLDGIRSQARDLAKDKTIDIPVPGYRHPELVARYRFIDGDEAKKLGELIKDNYESEADRLEAMMILPMIEACEGLYAREGKKLEPVDPDGGGPCRYDDRLETFFGGTGSGSAHAAVLAAFKGNGHAAVNHGRLLNKWFGDTSQTIEQLLGEG